MTMQTLDRRLFLGLSGAGIVSGAIALASGSAATAESFEIRRSDADWRQRLGPQRFAILRQQGTEKPRHKVEFTVGEFVRVKEGPFTDFNGTVEDVNYEKSKVSVSVMIFGRSTPVELEFGQVEKT